LFAVAARDTFKPGLLVMLKTVVQTATSPISETRLWPGIAPLIAFPFAAIVFRNHMPAWVFMWVLSFSIFASLKWMTWWTARNRGTAPFVRSIVYLLLWPGMDAETFLDPGKRVDQPPARVWIFASLKTLLGVVLLWEFARRVPADQMLLCGWIGLLGLIFLLHFGSFHLIALFWQSVGIDAEPIMSNPAASKSLSEFWGERWNLGFRQLAHDFIFSPLHKRIGPGAAGLLVFVVSGLIHDLVISLPARGGYGLPTGYFIVQGLGVMFERSSAGRKLGIRAGLRGWAFALVVTAAPAFWLFHPAFVAHVMLPFMHAIGAV
jgi:hypothetical protein